MNQMVFIHGPGAGGCAESFVHQLKHYPGSLAPTCLGIWRENCLDIWREVPVPMWNDIRSG